MIDKVEMINWRAYDRQEIIFQPGITFIMGANGRGKTSILEAIAYALTGEPATVSKRDKLLRNADKLATVRLSFTVDGQEYTVERSQSNRRAKKAKLLKVSTRKPLASSHRSVTTQIEKIMGVSADFLQRIVYMSEGDVFRFLKETSGKALNTQIRQVLGLTQLDEFLQALKVAEKEIKNQVREIQAVLGELEWLRVKRQADLERLFQGLDKRREELLAQLGSSESKITQLNREYEDLGRLADLLNQALPIISQDSKLWASIQNRPLLSLFMELEQQLQEVQDLVQQNQVAQARLEGEQVGYQRILDLLSPYAGRTETLPCPVCGKPMTNSEREGVIQEIQDNVQRLNQELQHLNRHQSEAKAIRHKLSQQVTGLRELRNNLAHVTFQSVHAEATVAELQQITQVHQVGKIKNELGHLQEQVAFLEAKLAELENEKANYLAIQNRLRNLAYNTPEEASEALVGLEVRSLSLRAASRAAKGALTTQRNIDMEAIYAQLARVWGAFSGEQSWCIQLDQQGIPTLEDHTGRQFDLSQLSGGEKTALLVMLHTIIGHHFAKSDFLLIDEPLEHLDPVNRRSLIRFLVSAYRRESFKQAIIATFEESLIRKYMSDEGVNVIYLS
jgi:DNA repair exonuclease SbcCD ATPase subunit